jgi:16S rRNA G966 N2-methylase RsmD
MTAFSHLYPDVGTAPANLTEGGAALTRSALGRASKGAKNTAAYNAHSYPTKVPPEGIEPFIAHYTEPGDLVLDPFCGSGMTGLAARRLGRRAVLNDLSFGATHLTWNLVTPCDAEELGAAAREVLRRVSESFRTLYEVAGRNGKPAHLHWTLYSQRVECPHCTRPASVWHEAADAERGTVGSSWQCRGCGRDLVRRNARLLGAEPVVVSVTDDRGRHDRAVRSEDLASLERIARTPLDRWVPRVVLGPDREMYIRSALHLQGISEVADFWTPRNLRALAHLWAEICAWPHERIRQALAFAFTNTAWHGTRMRRFNARGGQRPLTGTLYVPQLSIEVNVADVFAHKISQLQRFFRTLPADAPQANVLNGSATKLALPDGCIDYCFTDPPFGSNIFYADCAVVWESWLDAVTPTTQEAVVNRSLRPRSGGKTINDYAELMERSFKEMERVLKRNAWTTVVFQSSDPEVWSALRTATESAGFDVASASYFDKTQQSHKGYKGRSGQEDVASFDVVLSLHKPGTKGTKPRARGALDDAGVLLERHLAALPPVGRDEEADRQRTLPFLHSLLVQAHFNGSIGLEIGEYALVRRVCERRFVCDEHGHWSLPTTESALTHAGAVQS